MNGNVTTQNISWYDNQQAIVHGFGMLYDLRVSPALRLIISQWAEQNPELAARALEKFEAARNAGKQEGN